MVSSTGDQDRMRSNLTAFTEDPANGQSVSAWLVKKQGLAMEDLQAVRVPERVGLKPEYVDMPLGQVLGNQLGAQNCNYKWSNELSAALLLPPAEWNTVRSNLTTLTMPTTSGVASMRSASPVQAGFPLPSAPPRTNGTPPPAVTRRSSSGSGGR